MLIKTDCIKRAKVTSYKEHDFLFCILILVFKKVRGELLNTLNNIVIFFINKVIDINHLEERQRVIMFHKAWDRLENCPKSPKKD